MTHPTPPSARPKRPRRVTLFALAVLYLGVANLLRAHLALNGQPFAQSLPLSMPLFYLAACGLVWGAVFVISAWGMWRLQPWARTGMLCAIVVYQIHIWINHFAFDTSNYARQVWPFHAWLSAAWVVLVWGGLCLPGVRRLYAPRNA